MSELHLTDEASLLLTKDPDGLSDLPIVSEVVVKATKVFDETPLDTQEIPQQSLDLANRTRTNLFPWRGQFSPELVGLLLSRYASKGSLILDPFVGVGTTLFEAARQNHSSVGTEINPSAFLMAETSIFVACSDQQRRDTCKHARKLLEKALPEDLPLFSQETESVSCPSRIVATLAREYFSDPYLCNIFTNILVRLLSSPHSKDVTGTLRAFQQHESIIYSLPRSSQSCTAVHADARCLPVKNQTVDLVVTSPPYVNVFNYHQNNRPAMELLGWNILTVAKSEFGSNRKNRGNRFLTLVQYCVDVLETLLELKRVLKYEGRVVIIVGRESNIRGVSFQNGSIVATLALLSGFRLVLRQERKFTNKFGGLIYEDILHLRPGSGDSSPTRLEASSVAQGLLKKALPECLDEGVAADVQSAIGLAPTVEPSPLFRPASSMRN